MNTRAFTPPSRTSARGTRAFKLGPIAIIAPLTLLGLGSSACTETTLCALGRGGGELSCDPPIEPIKDNRIAVKGVACTENPDTILFPHKVLFVIDRSGSNTISDPLGNRADAALNAIQQYIQNRAISFAVIGFESEPQLLSEFSRDSDLLNEAIPLLKIADGATNYLDTLDMAYDLLNRDAERTPPGELSRTTYEIHWLSDGIPEPCQSPQAAIQKVQNIMQLKEDYGLFDISLHTVHLEYGAENLGCQDEEGNEIVINPSEFLIPMQEAGSGTFRTLTSDQLEFTIHFTEIRRSYVRRDFYMINENRVVWDDAIWPDSDGDGIYDDDPRFEPNPLVVDSNGDGCSDAVDYANQPNDPTICARLCEEQLLTLEGNGSLPDDDGDLIPNCAEQTLGFHRNSADADRDGFSDALELKFGTSSLDSGTLDQDSDEDGVNDADEIRLGTNPFSPESDDQFVYQYLPLRFAPPVIEGTSCFEFQIENVRLVETLATDFSERGENRICVYMAQAPNDDPQGEPSFTRACKSAKYLEEFSYKEPSSGFLEFVPEDFIPAYPVQITP